jgi:hypothetical protein
MVSTMCEGTTYRQSTADAGPAGFTVSVSSHGPAERQPIPRSPEALNFIISSVIWNGGRVVVLIISNDTIDAAAQSSQWVGRS